MVDRKNPQDDLSPILVVGAENIVHLIRVRKHHALGFPGGTGCKDDQSHLLGGCRRHEIRTVVFVNNIKYIFNMRHLLKAHTLMNKITTFHYISSLRAVLPVIEKQIGVRLLQIVH